MWQIYQKQSFRLRISDSEFFEYMHFRKIKRSHLQSQAMFSQVLKTAKPEGLQFFRVSVGAAPECDLQVQIPILALRKSCWKRECRLLTPSIKQTQVFALGKCRCKFMYLSLSGPSWNCIPYEIIGYCPASAPLRYAIHVGSGTYSWNHCAGFSNSFFGELYGFFYRAMWVTWGKASMLLQKTYVKSK